VQVRGLPEAELLTGGQFLVEIDPQPRAIGDRIATALQPELYGEKIDVLGSGFLGRRYAGFLPGEVGYGRARCTLAAVQIGPSGLWGMRSM
jgi:hypothetical protein